MQSVTIGLIKIGYASSVPDRFSALQTSSPDRLRLLGTMGGGQYAEASLHVAFDDLREHGEWFRSDRRLLAFIAENATPPDGAHWNEIAFVELYGLDRMKRHVADLARR